MTNLALRFNSVIDAIEKTAQTVGRGAGSVRLLAVSKTFESTQVEALCHLGQRAFGENYVQEAVAKMHALAKLKNQIEWHLIGPLQSNKTAVVAEHFDWVQTIDRLKIAQRLSEQRPAQLPPLNVCIQVNVDGGATKSGVDCTASPQAALDLALQISKLGRLSLRGLLAIPEPQASEADERAVFAKVQTVFDFLNQNGCKLDTLSMGMSADFEAAIAAGSTMVRIGSAIFGQRSKAA